VRCIHNIICIYHCVMTRSDEPVIAGGSLNVRKTHKVYCSMSKSCDRVYIIRGRYNNNNTVEYHYTTIQGDYFNTANIISLLYNEKGRESFPKNIVNIIFFLNKFCSHYKTKYYNNIILLIVVSFNDVFQQVICLLIFYFIF